MKQIAPLLNTLGHVYSSHARARALGLFMVPEFTCGVVGESGGLDDGGCGFEPK